MTRFNRKTGLVVAGLMAAMAAPAFAGDFGFGFNYAGSGRHCGSGRSFGFGFSFGSGTPVVAQPVAPVVVAQPVCVAPRPVVVTRRFCGPVYRPVAVAVPVYTPAPVVACQPEPTTVINNYYNYTQPSAPQAGYAPTNGYGNGYANGPTTASYYDQRDYASVFGN